MADGTLIEWTDASWPIIAGCDHVSEGCGLPRWEGDLPGGCYAAKLTAGRLKNRPEYTGLAEGGRFTGEVRLLEHRIEVPLHWRRPRKIFVSDMADLFHKDVPARFIAKVFAVMALCPQHTFQMLSKRYARMRSLLSSVEFDGLLQEEYVALAEKIGSPDLSAPALPLANVWVGCSAETQKWADIRIPALMQTPAAVRFVSAEPLIGPISLTHLHSHCPTHDFAGGFCTGPCPDRLIPDQIITGGESGPGARPAHPDWFRALRDQCQTAGIAYFHKQNGVYAPVADRPMWRDVWVRADGSSVPWDSDDGHTRHGLGDFRLGDAVLVRKVGKKAAGRLLDGREWSEYPQPVEVAR